MSKGEGKGWAKGRTAATDARIARAAVAHTGKPQIRRKPLSEMKWAHTSRTTLPMAWSAYRQLLGRTNKIGHQRTKVGGISYRLQFKDTRLYGWFQHVGLTPRKSLTLGAIDVPDEFLAPLVRGLLDGDGSISNAVWKADTTRRSDYYYEWLRTRFASASPAHLAWLSARLRQQLGLRGWIWQDMSRGQGMGSLSYGKHDSIRLLRWLYSDPNAPCLLRKREIWDRYVARHPEWVRETPVTLYA